MRYSGSGCGGSGIVGGGSGAGSGSGAGGGSGSGSGVGGNGEGSQSLPDIRANLLPFNYTGAFVAQVRQTGEGMDEQITAEELKRRLDAGDAVTIFDARKEQAWRASSWQIAHARRLPADEVASHLDDVPLGGLIVVYGDDEDAPAVARLLNHYGWTNVQTLKDGADGWQRAGYPVESKETRKISASEASANLQKAEGE